MLAKSEIVARVHQRALAAVAKMRESESELLEVLNLAFRHRVHTAMGYASLFAYATRGLGLSEDVAYIFISVAKKSDEIPELKQAIAAGNFTISKAKRIAPVLTKANKNHWLALAKSCSKRELEKLVAEEAPQTAVMERVRYVGRDRVELQMGMSEALLIKFRRAQDLLSQKRRRPCSLEETIEYVLDFVSVRIDPVKKAKRQLVKGKLGFSENERQSGVSKDKLGPGPVALRIQKSRRPISARTRHKLNLKYQGQCAFIDLNGIRCPHRRFLDVHHIKPVSQGGTDELENLELLCSGHHRVRHEGISIQQQHPPK